MADQIIDDYMSSLDDLTFNSKPHINMLTMVAEENVKYAEAIVKVIEQHLKQTKPAQMLPVMYLIDSIVKNVPQSTYKEMFARNLVNTFCGVFEKVDEKTRTALFKLRQTWPTIFPNSKLYALDMGVQQLDPAWPITATPAEAKPQEIHVNPKFLKQRQDEELRRQQMEAEAAAKDTEDKHKQDMAAHALMQQQLFEKQQELLRLQQQKLEMELLEAKERIAQQQRELSLKEHQLRLEEAKKLQTQKEEEERAVKIKQDQERAATLRREQEKAEALKKQLEAKAAVIKQKAAANRKDLAAAVTAVKDPRLQRDPRLANQLTNVVPPFPRQERSDPRQERVSVKQDRPDPRQERPNPWQEKSDPRQERLDPRPERPDSRQQRPDPRQERPDPRKEILRLEKPVGKAEKAAVKQDKPATIPKLVQGAKVITPATRMEENEFEDDPEKADDSTNKSKDSKSTKSTTKKDEKRATLRKERDKTASRTSRSSRNNNRKDSQRKTADKKDDRKSPEKNKSNQPSKTVNRRLSARSYRNKRQSESPEVDEVNAAKRSRSKSPRGSMSPSKSRDSKERDRRRDQKRSSSKDNDEPPNKMVKPEENKENKKLPDDLAALFGTEDQDYRSLPPIPKLNTDVSGADSLVSPSPHSAGWARFKASRPEEFPFSQPRSIPMTGSKDVDMRSPSDMLSPTSTFASLFPSVLSPDQENTGIPKPMLLDSAESILKEAQMQLKAGKLSHEQHQELLKQLDQLFKLQSLKQRLRQTPTEGNVQQVMAAQRAYDEHTLKIRETIDQIGEKSAISELRRSDSMVARSPLSDDPRNRRDSYSGSRSGRPEYNRRLSFGRHSASHAADKPMWEVPPGEFTLPYDLTKKYVPEHDPRWFVPSEGPEVLHEVVIDGRGWELPYSNISRPIKVGPQTVSVKADPHTREITINDQVYYRVGDPVRSIMLHGFSHTVYYHGPIKKLWLNNIMYEVQADGPPVKITIGNDEHYLCVDSIANQVVVDGHVVCNFGDHLEYILVAGKKCDIQFIPPAKQILIDGTLCELEFTAKYPCVYIKGKAHGIRFDGPAREILINGKPWTVQVDRPRKAKFGSARVHILGLGGPGHEIIIDGKWYEVKFNGPEKQIQVGPRLITIQLVGPPPEVKILGEIVTDPDEIEDLCNGYEIDPSMAIDTVIKVTPLAYSNFTPTPVLQGPPEPRPPMQGGPGSRPDRFGQRGGYNQRGFNGHGRFRGPQQFNDFGYDGPRNRFHGPDGFGPRGRGRGNFNQRGQFQQRMRGPRSRFPQGPQDMGPSMGLPMSDGYMGDNYQHGYSNDGYTNDGYQNYDAGAAEQEAPQVDVNDLFSKLLQFGIINKEETRSDSPSQQDAMQPSQPPPHFNVLQLISSVKKDAAEKEAAIEDIPDLTDISMDKLKLEHKGVVQRLYSGFQCSSCGVRFIAQDTDKYREHLDWHFRQNKKEKEEIKVAKFRRWYYTMLEWIQYEEISEYDDRAQSAYFEKVAQVAQTQAASAEQPTQTPAPREADNITSCPVAGDAADDVCNICGDPFEQFWSEELEEWHLKDAIRADGKTYHPVCYEDYRETSMLETPTPDHEQTPKYPATAQSEAGKEEEEMEVDAVENPTSVAVVVKHDSASDVPVPVVADPQGSPQKPASEAVASHEAVPDAHEAAPATDAQQVESEENGLPSALPNVNVKVEQRGNEQSQLEEAQPMTCDMSASPASVKQEAPSSLEATVATSQEPSSSAEQEAQAKVDLQQETVLSPEASQEAPSSRSSQGSVDSPRPMVIEDPPASPEDSQVDQAGKEPESNHEPEQSTADNNDTIDEDVGSPDVMLNIEPLDSPKTPLQDEPPTPEGSPPPTSPVISRLSLLNKEVLTKNPMALVLQTVNSSAGGVSSAQVSPVTSHVSPVPAATSAPSSAKSSPVPQLHKDTPTQSEDVQPIRSVIGYRRR